MGFVARYPSYTYKALAGVCNPGRNVCKYQRKQNLSDGVANPVTLMRLTPLTNTGHFDENTHMTTNSCTLLFTAVGGNAAQGDGRGCY